MLDHTVSNEVGLLISILALGLFLLGAMGSGRDWWRHEIGFGLAAFAALTSVFALVIIARGWSFDGIGALSASTLSGFAAAAIGLAVVVIPVAFLFKVATSPWIHDITTDFDDPPSFTAAAALRPAHADSTEYPGERAAAIQRVAYPDVAARTFAERVPALYARALDLARANRWNVVSELPDQGTIEAVASSALFGFDDDIVIRITPSDSGCRVDMRSASRVGDTDLGVNAHRIVTFLAALSRD